uniref:Protein kinase domain-containing protein n=1 Tax=Oryzias latipes TaxID=8090 RepID=A0A3P9K4M0_ORYLA
TEKYTHSFEVQENFLLIGNKGSYLVEKFLGEGTFGKVAKCKNLSTNKEVAIKILKNGFDNAGENELKALIEVSKLDADEYNLVKCVDVFLYKSHVCIVFEILDQSLYDFLEDRRFRPLFVQEIRAIAWQLLIALKGLKSINLVHCDIKLDNIMLVNQDSKPFRVKLIDFGLASKTKDIPTGTRLQNICFRAPEVILGLPLDERLDMWTVGYVLALLYTGFCIHPWDSEYNIIRAMVEMQGMPDSELLHQGLYTNKFFTKTEENSKKKMTEVEQLIDLIKQMLEVDPNKRISPNDALRHPFFILEKKEAKTTKPQEPAAVQVHQQAEAKEVTSIPQGPAANPQERSSDNNKTSLVQQQKAEKRKNPAGSRKRKNSDRQSQDREKKILEGFLSSIRNAILKNLVQSPPLKLEIGEEYAYIEKSLGVPTDFTIQSSFNNSATDCQVCTSEPKKKIFLLKVSLHSVEKSSK